MFKSFTNENFHDKRFLMYLSAFKSPLLRFPWLFVELSNFMYFDIFLRVLMIWNVVFKFRQLLLHEIIVNNLLTAVTVKKF